MEGLCPTNTDRLVMQDKPCVPQSPYPHQFTHSFPFLTCKYICSEISPPGWQVQARLRCKCSPSCAKTSCGEHHVQPNRSAKIHLFTRFFSDKILNTGWLFPQQNALGLTIELLCGRRWAPRTFCWTGISECSGSEGSGSDDIGFRKVPKVRTSC